MMAPWDSTSKLQAANAKLDAEVAKHHHTPVVINGVTWCNSCGSIKLPNQHANWIAPKDLKEPQR